MRAWPVLADYILPNVYADAVQDSKKELTDPIEFLKRKYPRQSLFRFILTHPDLDHMRGVKRLHESIGFTNFWDTAHTKPTPDYRSDSDREDWEFYQTLWSGSVRNYTRGDSCFAFGKDENGLPGGDNIEILSPTPALVKSCNQAGKSNDLSLVLRIRHNAWSVLLPGDAEAEAWDDMKNHYGAELKSDYFKASHHGRDSGYHLEAMKLIAPRVTFVSVGRKPDTDANIANSAIKSLRHATTAIWNCDSMMMVLGNGSLNGTQEAEAHLRPYRTKREIVQPDTLSAVKRVSAQPRRASLPRHGGRKAASCASRHGSPWKRPFRASRRS